MRSTSKQSKSKKGSDSKQLPGNKADDKGDLEKSPKSITDSALFRSGYATVKGIEYDADGNRVSPSVWRRTT